LRNRLTKNLTDPDADDNSLTFFLRKVKLKMYAKRTANKKPFWPPLTHFMSEAIRPRSNLFEKLSGNFITNLQKKTYKNQKKVRLLSSASGSVKFFVSLFLKNYQRYPFETWNTCSLSKEEPITTRQMTL
jgi:hypothetical protein